MATNQSRTLSTLVSLLLAGGALHCAEKPDPGSGLDASGVSTDAEALALDAGAPTDAGRDAGASSADAALGCEANRDCPPGLYCQFLAPGDTCARPRCASAVGGGCHCGRCTVPRTSVIACGADPAEGDPCDEAANLGHVCRWGSCTIECLPECQCVAGRWECSVVCNDFCNLPLDGGYGCLSCGTPPMCLLHCRN